MNPHIASMLCDQRREDLGRQMRAGQARRALHASRAHRASGRSGLPRWNVSWTRLSPGDMPGVTGGPGAARSSWMIIISAGRPG